MPFRPFLLAASIMLLAPIDPAISAIIITAQETGVGVEVSGEGQVDLSALTFLRTGGAIPELIPSLALLILGAPPDQAADVYIGLATAPAQFGIGGASLPADAGAFGPLGASANAILVPDGYLSNTNVAATSTWTGETFASLGMTPGTYVWTWGSGSTADSLTLNIVPEPDTALLLATGLVLMSVRRRATATR
jgi:hypothetical protein